MACIYLMERSKQRGIKPIENEARPAQTTVHEIKSMPHRAIGTQDQTVGNSVILRLVQPYGMSVSVSASVDRKRSGSTGLAGVLPAQP